MDDRFSWMRGGLGAALAASAMMACGGPDGPGPNGEPPNVPGTELWIDAGDGMDHGMMQELSITATGDVMIERTFTTQISVEGIFEDGATVALPDRVSWEVANPSVLEVVEATAEGVELRGLEMGTTDLTATLGALSVVQPITVVRASAETLTVEVVEAPGLMALGEIRANATFRDGTSGDVTMEASWSSSDPSGIATFDDPSRKGLLFGVGRSAATITATLDGISASADVQAPCGLEPSSSINNGQVLPNMSWANSVMYDLEGSRTDMPLSVEQMMCDPAFDGYRAFIFSLNAGWCGPCHAWMRTAAASEAQLAQEGILPVFVIGDTATQGTYGAADTAYAERLTQTHAQDAMSIRVGDAETMGAGSQGIKQVLNITNGWPSLFVVRRSDMRVLTLASGAPRTVDSIVQTVNVQTGGGGSGPQSLCEDGVDEALEPNDIVQIAAPLGEGELSAGICNSAPDFFRVNIEGPWKVTATFQNANVDIDLYEWNVEADAIMIRDNKPSGSFSPTSSFESLELSGEAVIKVQAKQAEGRRSGPYTLVVERL